MAPKKPIRKKKPPKKQKKRAVKKFSLKIQLLKICAGLFILLVLVISAGFALNHLLVAKEKTKPVLFETAKSPQKAVVSSLQPDPAPPKKLFVPETTIKTTKVPEFKKPLLYEIFPEEDVFLPKPLIKPPIADPLKDRPKVAIIIDDLGYDPYMARHFVELDPKFTFSILPHSPYLKKTADIIRERGGELMLHIPMEPNEYPRINPGPGALLSIMEPDQLIAQLNENLDTLSDAKGINNHMGSKLTANSEQMYQVFSVLKGRDLYFIDSLTTSESVCKPSAELFKVPFAQRDVFIDHFLEPEFMRMQILRLIKHAKTHGKAIGIAHPHKETLEILRQHLPELKKQVEVVPASHLVR